MSSVPIMELIPTLFPSSLSLGIRFEKVKNNGALAIYFPSLIYESVDEFIGYVDVCPDGYVNLYILAEYYDGCDVDSYMKNNGELRPDIKSRLKKLFSEAPLVREYRINADSITLLRHFRNPKTY